MKILSVDTNHYLLNKQLQTNGFQVDEDISSSRNEILQKIESYDGLIIRSRFPVDKEFLERAKNLKFIGRVGAGLENIDEVYAKEKGIEIFNAPEGNRDSVGEHTVGMLLMLLHRLKLADLEVRNGIWKREENRGDELMEKTIGIIGYGHMGSAFAQRLQGFGVQVLCYDILPNKGDRFAKQVSLREIFNSADVVSLHTPETPENVHMVDEKFIDSFKKPFYFLNTARGKAVKTSDLVEGLKSKKIVGACLDVHEYEKSSFENLNSADLPADFHYLLNAQNVILTPHIAGWTHQSKEKLAQVIVDKIINWKKIHNIANSFEK